MTMTNPYLLNTFSVSIDKIDAAIQFREVTGLDSANTVVLYREGADKMNAIRKIPGLEETKVAVFKRGITGSMALWEWRKEVRDSSTTLPPYRTVTVTLNDPAGGAVMTWTLINAWCSKLSGPLFNASALNDAAIAIEAVEVSFDRIEIKQGA